MFCKEIMKLELYNGSKAKNEEERKVSHKKINKRREGSIVDTMGSWGYKKGEDSRVQGEDRDLTSEKKSTHTYIYTKERLLGEVGWHSPLTLF